MIGITVFFCALLWVEGLFLDWILKKSAEGAHKRLLQMVSGGVKGEPVIVKRAGKIWRLMPRISRTAQGLKKYEVEYYYRLDEEFEAYFFAIPGNRLNFLRQSKFVVPRDEFDKFLSRAA